MEVVELAGQMLHAAQIIGKRFPGKGAAILHGGTQIQRVRRVGDDGGKGVTLQQCRQGGGVRFVQRFGTAAPGVAGKELKGICPQVQSLAPHGGQTPGGG